MGTIDFPCPACGHRIRAPKEAGGKLGTCKQCNSSIRVPYNTTDAPVPQHKSAQKERVPEVIPASTEAQNPFTQNENELEPRWIAPRQAPRHVVPPVLAVALQRRSNSAAITSLVLGGIGLLLCWIPIAGVLSFPIGSLGLLLAAVGLFIGVRRDGAGIGFSVGGGVLSAIALIVSFAWVGAASNLLSWANSGPSQLKEMRHAAETAGPVFVDQGVEVQVVSSAIVLPEHTGLKDKMWQVEISINNRNATRKVDYLGFGVHGLSLPRDFLIAKDEFENVYSGMGDPDSGKALFPGESVQDLLMFEQPIPQAKSIIIAFPKSAIGGDGTGYLKIAAPVAK